MPNGTDVYHGVPKDYTGKNHTVANFFGALKGDPELAKAGHKVVNSTPNDHIFIYFIDHGAPGFVVFPNEEMHNTELVATLKNMHTNNRFGKLVFYLEACESGFVVFPNEEMHNTELVATLKNMHTNNRFGKLVFYLEACESGSMFEKLLPDNINVYAMTSTNSTELGWNCCRDTVRGAWVSKYLCKLFALGSYFGYYWYKNWQSSDFLTETLQDQFEYLHNTTNQTGVMEPGQHAQHAHQWGDLSITKLPVSQFQGTGKFIGENSYNADDHRVCNLVNTRDLPVRMLEMNIEETDDINEKLRYENELKQLLNGRKYMDKHMAQYVSSIQHLPGIDVNSVLNTKHTIDNNVCYRKMVDTFRDNCFNINKNTYALGKMTILVNICNQLSGSPYESVAIEQLAQYCQHNVHQYPIEIK
ncbi:unnamed protein product [Oppiella nova]|uniref:Legumain prodomain domain-containing protein n=1 Tax=Oppiella nova TaxID=334625 RepID=A0A7R9QRT8_9ACAR|nr:unnamed protein product [Oppiella nova]CAG2171976.1 unnamed protein product [Oppiella nova]